MAAITPNCSTSISSISGDNAFSAAIGIEPARLGGLDALDRDAVLPVVAHVVGVIEGSDPFLDETGERGAAGAIDLMPPAGIVGVRHAVGLVVGGELPQVIVEPAHDGLDDTVQGLQIGRGLDRDAAPDQRLDINQFDTQDGNVIGAHVASLADWRRQLHGDNSPSRLIGWPLPASDAQTKPDVFWRNPTRM